MEAVGIHVDQRCSDDSQETNNQSPLAALFIAPAAPPSPSVSLPSGASKRSSVNLRVLLLIPIVSVSANVPTFL